MQSTLECKAVQNSAWVCWAQHGTLKKVLVIFYLSCIDVPIQPTQVWESAKQGEGKEKDKKIRTPFVP